MAAYSTGTFLIPTDVQQQNKPRMLLNVEIFVKAHTVNSLTYLHTGTAKIPRKYKWPFLTQR